MNRRVVIFSLIIGLLSFILWSCGGSGGHYTPPAPATKNVNGAAMKDFMLGSTVKVYDSTGAQVNEGNCTTTDYGVFNCTIKASAKAPYTIIVSGGKLDKDGKSATANDTAPADNVTLATVVPDDKTSVAATPITTAIVMDELGINNPEDLDNATNVKEVAGKSEAITSRFDAFKTISGLVYINPATDNLTAAESNVKMIVESFDSTGFDNTTGVYTGDVAALVQKIQEDVSDGALDGKKDNESITGLDNKTVEIPDNITENLPKVYATCITIGGKKDDNLTDGLTIDDADSLDKIFKVKIAAENADGTYTIAAEFYAKDLNGKREITATLSGATVTIDNGSITAVVAKDIKVDVDGTASDGTPVKGALTNLAADTITAVDSVLTYNLANVEAKLATLDEKLKEVFVEGSTYEVKLNIKGLPQFSPIVGTVTVGVPECGAGTFLKYCTTEGDCTGAGGFWYDNKCNSEAQCSVDNLTACNTQAKCEGIGKYWYDNKCNANEQTQPAAEATVTKTGDVTGTAGGTIGFKATVTLPEGMTCDNCTYIWDLDSNGKVDGQKGSATVTAYYGEAAQGTATVYVVNADGQCVAKGTIAYNLAGDALGGTPPQALDLVSLVEDSQTAVPDCQ